MIISLVLDAKTATDICKTLDDMESTFAVYYDLSKTFDTIGHSIYLKKVDIYGTKGHILDSFFSYLYNRKQCVHYMGSDSHVETIKSGIPQGSVLGPLFFTIYSNDHPRWLKLCKSILLADDTTVYLSF